LSLELFPYHAPRPGQVELMSAVAKAVEERRSLAVNAPSGFGKTVAVLAGALSKCRRVAWFTRTHRQAERVVEEVKAISSRKPLTALALQSRSSLCPYSQGLPPDEAAVYCRERRAACDLYRGFLSSFTPPPSLILKPSEVYAFFLERGVCPYYVEVSLAGSVNVVAASFLFLTSHLARRSLHIDEDTVVVFDEAHGLLDALSANQSLDLTFKCLDEALNEAEGLRLKSLTEFVGSVKELLLEMGEGSWRPRELASLLQERTEYSLHVLAESMMYWGNEVRGDRARRGERPRSHLYNLGQFLHRLLTSGDEFVAIAQPEGVRLICLSAKLPRMEARCYVFLSATLDKALLEELGVEVDYLDLSSYASYSCKSFILSDVTSRYHERSRAAKRYARYLKLLSSIPVNVASFFPSYELLNKVKEELRGIEKPVFYEREGMPSLEHEALLSEFKSFGGRGGALYLGVCGGRASEGVDYPGEELDIVFIAGVPFEEPSKVVEAKLNYYVDRYGSKGRALAYVMPALRKVAQAAGRAFRGPGDRGVVVLGDRRFKKLSKMLPRWLKPSVEVDWEKRGLLLKSIAEHLGLGIDRENWS